MANKQIVIIGNGMVGHKFIEQIVESGAHEFMDLHIFCEEPRVAYDRVQLTSYLSGKTIKELTMVEDGFYEEHGVNIHIGDRAASIDRDKKVVTSEKGVEIAYDKVILATGSYPFVPPIPGKDADHCLVYRTIEDLDAIRASSQGVKVGVVVGGGLLGLEAANAIKEMGLETNVVEFAPRLMAVQVDEGGGEILRKKIENLGVNVHTGKNTKQIVEGESCRYKMEFADDTELETDVIVFSAGIRPRDDIARDCELEIGERGGIVVNNNCQTSDDDIYAIGECALWSGRIFGLVAPGYDMAQAAVDHLTGGTSEFTGADMSTKLKLLGIDVASIGDSHARAPGAISYTFCNEADEVYKKIVVSADKKILTGAVLVGDADDYGTLLSYMQNEITLPEHPDSMILPNRDGAATGLGVDALPDSAQICSCHNVSKGDIIEAVQNGATDIAAVKSCTKAGTGCGGCAVLTTQVMKAELKKQGVEVNNNVCEHFTHTRQELYHLVRVNKITSFQELVSKHGHGRGCDICKPAVASIMASCWNEHLLQKDHAGIQDTNDFFLANMQKDGTYSVIPRIPGGEITPEKLIIIGEIAKKYKLYTKITGGQRIDLLGARSEQLPPIWKELVDAGFESGHAYGKAMRTVKSCVGQTWCRYGVDDSVSLAIEIEKRYRGLRSPHKIKMAVSGCTRECAEAQSKDVGVIATENGWNLFVCGNGGMKPRHGDLFAADLDKETLVKYIDRFFMFYIKTADRLQRTSTWMENMEGGLDYLRAVIIDDSLGICDQLEEEMGHIIKTYACEWKKVIEDEDMMKRFRHFVNSEETDDNVVFVQERGQIRPATEDERQELTTSR
ncbi:MAG: nitrite reductase large subunit [Planctomycetes bacterium]|nr:nitrite reductase large subunit [Planctomycetota bacterium]